MTQERKTVPGTPVGGDPDRFRAGVVKEPHGDEYPTGLASVAIDDLEFSVKSRNMLIKHGVLYADQLVTLTRETVQGWGTGNARLWKEVQEVLQALRYDDRLIVPQSLHSPRLERARAPTALGWGRVCAHGR